MTTAKTATRIHVNGKFFDRLGHKFFFKAMRFDPGPPLLERGAALDFNQKVTLRKRFDELNRAHTTGLIVPGEQAAGVLGVSGQAGLRVMVELPVASTELSTGAGMSKASARLAEAVRTLRIYPALMGYLIDCCIEPDELRNSGIASSRRRLSKLIAAVRSQDPDRLVAVRHRPTTIGLAILDEDLIYAEMPALAPAELQEYIVRLHNLAEARPVVIEFGTGIPGQDELVALAFGLGVAGVVAPAVPPVAAVGGLGLRRLSAGETLPFVALNGSCPPKPAQVPMVSVVICAYNAERTMRACLESLRTLDYPNYEVVIVDDGSRDSTAAIAMDLPEFRLIRQPNKGLSVARNVGMQAAHGELIAYTDSDCVVDPHWLTLIARALTEQGFDGCGGPNYAPHEDGWIEGCVAASPGAPCHVLVGDDRAEHLAGCNMVYRKAALEKIGGFDPQFTTAGDDVDICWRMIDAGFRLGFCPAAFVWHFRRNTVKAYYGQQRGYGKAEAMLFLKYPDRFNALGQIRWRGTIPGVARTIPGGAQPRIRWSRDHQKLQRVSEAPLSVLKVLPMTAEWNAGAILALLLSLGLGVTLLPALAMLLLAPIWALYYAANAPLEKCHRSLTGWLLIAWLAYTGPISRTIARDRSRKSARQRDALDTAPRQKPVVEWLRRTVRLAYWNEAWTLRESLLERINRLQAQVGRPTVSDGDWSDADLVVEAGALTRIEIKTADEEHSGNRIKNHVAIRGRLTRLTRVGLMICTAGALGAAVTRFDAVALVLGAVVIGITVCAASEMIEAMRLVYRVVEQSAGDLGLLPLGQLTAAAVAPTATIAEVGAGDSAMVQSAGR